MELACLSVAYPLFIASLASFILSRLSWTGFGTLVGTVALITGIIYTPVLHAALPFISSKLYFLVHVVLLVVVSLLFIGPTVWLVRE